MATPKVEKVKDPIDFNAHPLRSEVRQINRAIEPERIAAQEDINRIIALESQPGMPPQIPTGAIVATVQALGLKMPEALEDRTIAVTKMYLDGKSAAEIAQALKIHPKAVEAELVRIDIARSKGLRTSPELGQKVVNEHFTVIADSAELICRGKGVLTMLEESIALDHKEILAWERQPDECSNCGTYVTPANPGPACMGCGQTLVPKKAGRGSDRRPGHRAMVLQSYWQGFDAIGRHQDRMAEILGLLRGKNDKNLNAVVQNITVNNTVLSSTLNKIADEMLKAYGQVPIELDATPLPPIQQLPGA